MSVLSISSYLSLSCRFFFNDTATTEIYTLSLHDALPICPRGHAFDPDYLAEPFHRMRKLADDGRIHWNITRPDRKSTRLNSSHANISYAVFCLKKKKNSTNHRRP